MRPGRSPALTLFAADTGAGGAAPGRWRYASPVGAFAPQEGHGGAAASPSLQVRLFGPLEVRAAGRPLAPVGSARLRALVAYLALHAGTSVSRQHLAFLLWPDSTEAQALTNLRKALHLLRHEHRDLEPLLDVTGRTLGWRLRDGVWVDVAAFDAALAQAGTAPDRAEACAALRRAVELYRGELLEDCYDDWLLEEREQRRDRYRGALRRLTDLLLEEGRPEEAIETGRRLVRADPLREDAYQLLMRVHDAAGDRAGAVRAYHECVGVLRRELGVEPARETRRAYEALAGTPGASPATEGEPATLPGSPLVGRHDAWAALTARWQAAERGQPALVLVTGEPGIGKTRLVEELRSWCGRRGALTAEARCYQSEGELGHGVASAWLTSDELRAAVTGAPPADRSVLGRLVPDLAPEDALSGANPSADDRRRLFDAVARALSSAGRPLLLAVDDAHWADGDSLALLHFLLRPGAELPLLAVATLRWEDLDERHPLSTLTAALQRFDRISEIALERLSPAETELLGRQLGLDPPLVADLYAETEGNPLFVIESVRAAGEGAAPGERMTPKLQAVITARLRRCTGTTADVLAAAATIGRAFTTELIRGVAGLDDPELAAALDELWRRGLIREHGTTGYDFSHGRIRDVAYDRLDPAVRRRLHGEVASALQRVAATGPAMVSGQVAAHLDRAGRLGEALDWYRRAAMEAQRRFAAVEAVRLLERARELASDGDADDPVRLRRELDVLGELPTALVGVDGFASDRVDEVQQRALAVAGRLAVDPGTPLLRSLVMSRLCRHDFAGAQDAAAELAGTAARDGDELLLVESAYLLGIAAFWAADVRLARSHFEHVVSRFPAERRIDHILRFGHDPELVCLSRLGNTLWFLGEDDLARQAAADAVAHARQGAHPYTQGAVLGFAALLALDLGDVDDLRAHVASLLRQEQRTRPTEAFAQAFLGYLAVLEGRGREGLDAIRHAMTSVGPVDPAPGVGAGFRRILLAAHVATGDPGEALAAADAVLAAPGSSLWEAELRRLRAEALAAIEAPWAEVTAELDRAEAVARRQGAEGLARRVAASRQRLAPAGRAAAGPERSGNA